MFGNVASPLAGLGVWGLGGALSLVGALCYAELAATWAQSGGDYVYLSRAYGSWLGFLFGWAQLVAILTSSIGAMAYVFADYSVAFFGRGDAVAALRRRLRPARREHRAGLLALHAGDGRVAALAAAARAEYTAGLPHAVLPADAAALHRERPVHARRERALRRWSDGSRIAGGRAGRAALRALTLTRRDDECAPSGSPARGITVLEGRRRAGLGASNVGGGSRTSRCAIHGVDERTDAGDRVGQM